MRFWTLLFAVLAVAVMGLALTATDAQAQYVVNACPAPTCQPGTQPTGVAVQVTVPGRPFVVYEPYVRYRPVIVTPRVPVKEAWVVRRYGLFGLRGYSAYRLQ